MDFLHFMGRFHPLAVHLPIGFLIMAILLEWWSRRNPLQQPKGAVGFALQATMWASVFAATLGYLLSLEGGYTGYLIDWHKWLGFSFTLSSVVLYLLHLRRKPEHKNQHLFNAFLLFTFLLLSLTGHYGGMLTHGSDFLTEKAPIVIKKILGETADSEALPIGLNELDSAVVFTRFIQPILKAKCTSCHNPGKFKGELLLHSIEGIKKGGKNGAAFVAHQIKESAIVQRIELPLNDEEHMPPQGKKQVSENELALLQWWIAEGASFDKKVADCTQPEKIRAILEAQLTPPNGIYAMNIPPISDRKLSALQELGVPVFAIAKESSFLEANFSGKQNININQVQALKKAGTQLTKLNLSRSNCTDEMLQVIDDLPHLTYLNLSKTKVTNQGLIKIKGLNYLEYLNLFGTEVNDSVLAIITALPELKRLYLWQTQVQPSAIEALQKQLPQLMINHGEETDSTFASAQLKPPLVQVSKELFNDTVQVALKLNFPGAQIYYTLDGSKPDTHSILYQKPFILDKSSLIKTISHKSGWAISAINEKQVLKVKYKANVVNLTTPNERYAGTGPGTLTDFAKGTLLFQDGQWLGYQKKDLDAVLDLGGIKEISGVTIGALENVGSWIFFPKGLNVWVSKDGKNYQEVVNKTYETAKEQTEPQMKNFTETFSATQARFVKVKVKNTGINPSWHPAPGEPSWVFVDEILIE